MEKKLLEGRTKGEGTRQNHVSSTLKGEKMAMQSWHYLPLDLGQRCPGIYQVVHKKG